MRELISEIEAFTAWKNGQDVEIYDESMCWHPLVRDHGLCVFDSNGRVKFRLKPRTVNLNGVEVPAPFEPKDGDTCFILDTEQDEGFYRFTFSENSGVHKNYVYLGAWRTEEEIKQVVAALRSIFKPQ